MTVLVLTLSCYSIWVDTHVTVLVLTLSCYSICVDTHVTVLVLTVSCYSICVDTHVTVLVLTVSRYSICVDTHVTVIALTLSCYSSCVDTVMWQYLYWHCVCPVSGDVSRCWYWCVLGASGTESGSGWELSHHSHWSSCPQQGQWVNYPVRSTTLWGEVMHPVRSFSFDSRAGRVGLLCFDDE